MNTRRTLVLASLCSLVAVSASATGLNLRWDACAGDLGVMNKVFACNTNIGNATIYGSFVLPANMTQVSGNEITVDIATAGATLSPWWEFRNAGSCRQNSLSFSSITLTSTACLDWSQNQAAGGIAAYQLGLFGPNSARVLAVGAVPVPALATLAAGQEYFSFTLTVNYLKSVGSGSCGGCNLGACLKFRKLTVTTAVNGNDVTVTGPADGFSSDVAAWQGGAGVAPTSDPACFLPTPTRASTWAGVKALYH